MFSSLVLAAAWVVLSMKTSLPLCVVDSAELKLKQKMKCLFNHGDVLKNLRDFMCH